MIPVHADLGSNGRIEVQSPWYKDAAYEAKQTPGAKWNPDGKFWSYPLTMDSCHSLRSVYGDRLKVGQRLSAWARNAIALENKMREIGAAHDAELSIVPETFHKMATAMGNRTYQRSGARFVAEGRRVGIFDEVGLGKTITSLAGVIEAGAWEGEHLVVSNKTSLEAVWKNQTDDWTEGRAEVHVCGLGAYKKNKAVIDAYMASKHPSKWLVVNPAMLMVKVEDWCNKCKKWEKDLDSFEDIDHYTLAHKTEGRVSVHKFPELQQIEWTSVIVDEAHKILSTGVKSAANKGLTQTARGLKSLTEARDSVRIALTGTPARGKELNMWGIMHWLWPATYTSKWDWVNTYFETSRGYGNSIEIGPLREDMRERFFAMLDRHTLRRTRKEVRADLPEAESYTDWVQMSGKHLKQYEEMMKTGEANLGGEDVIAIGILAEMTRLKQFAFGVWDVVRGKLKPTADSPKIRRLDDILEEVGITGDSKEDFRASETHYKYIVASQFKEIIDFMQEYYESRGIASLKITGDITGPKRAEAVRSFQEDPDGPRLLFMTSQAGGESITLDRYCDTIYEIDESFVADDGLQLLGRIDNRSVSAEEAVPRRVVHISTKGTIEEAIAASNMSQLEMEHALLDGRRGLELARNIMRKVVQ